MGTPVAERQAAVNAILADGTTYYMQGHDGDPGTSGANQITAQTRVAFVAGANSDGSTDNNAQIQFANVQTEITHVGVFTAATGGTYKTGGTLNYGASPPAFQAGETVTIAAAGFVFSIPAS